MPLWWRRYDTCRAMGWTPAEYEAMPVRLIVETEYALAMERRHQAAESRAAQ